MPYFSVYHIENPTAVYNLRDLNQRRLRFFISKNDTVRTLKRRVAAIWGVPPERQTFYGVSSLSLHNGKCRFNTSQILRNGDAPLVGTLDNLFREGHIEFNRGIVVVFLPADEDDASSDGDEPRVVREVDAVAGRIAAGRANAVEIADDSSGSEEGEGNGDDDDDDDDDGSPQRKRPRRTAGGCRAAENDADEDRRPNEEGDADGRDDGEDDGRAGDSADATNAAAAASAGTERDDEGGDEDNGQDEEADGKDEEVGDAAGDPAAEAAGADGGTGGDEAQGLARGDDAENEERNHGGNTGGDDDAGRPEARTVDGEDERGDDPAVGALVAVPAAAEETAAAAAENAEPSELRRWLKGLDANGSNSGRYERYAPAFEREFDCCTAVAAAADEPNGLDNIFRACGVDALGDKAILRREISKLQRPD